jgi:hypothetical protein
MSWCAFCNTTHGEFCPAQFGPMNEPFKYAPLKFEPLIDLKPKYEPLKFEPLIDLKPKYEPLIDIKPKYKLYK